MFVVLSSLSILAVSPLFLLHRTPLEQASFKHDETPIDAVSDKAKSDDADHNAICEKVLAGVHDQPAKPCA